jgi:hypothetical protein
MVIDTDTALLTIIVVMQTPIYSLIKIGVTETFIKPLAVRRAQEVLGALKVQSDLVKQAWSALDYSLPESVDNFLGFLGDAEKYIWDTVLPRIDTQELTAEQKQSLVKYLMENWDQKVFLSKIQK